MIQHFIHDADQLERDVTECVVVGFAFLDFLEVIGIEDSVVSHHIVRGKNQGITQ